MPQTPVHPMMAVSSHDEQAEQNFMLSLKAHVFAALEPQLRAVTLAEAAEAKRAGEEPNLQVMRRRMESKPIYQNWVSSMRATQELMWQTAGDCVDRQEYELEAIAARAPELGSVRTNPDFVVPRYLAASDTHMMPGSYYTDPTGHDVRQGALFDKAASLYAMGRQGGVMSEMRGHTVIKHMFERFPDIEPKRILDMGCTVGNSTCGVARTFPNAEVHAIDVGASLLRYAHARAAHLGVSVHFSQQSAEETDFPDGYFDLVYSCAMVHETSAKAFPRILQESRRLVRPGGVVIHLEVPFRAEDTDEFDLLRADYETRFNCEPFWFGAVSTDLAAAFRAAGFTEVAAGYQDAAFGPVARGDVKPGGFGGTNKGPYLSWYVASGRKAGA